MTFTELKDNLSYMYRDFFEDMKIDSKTGVVIGNNLRFTGFPYIGRNYVTTTVHSTHGSFAWRVTITTVPTNGTRR